MKLKVSVFEYLNQKVMYIQDVNYYFGIRDNFDIKLGDYELSEEEVLNIAKENDPEEYEIFINTSIEERINKINTYSIDDIKEQSSYGQFTLCLHPSRKCNLNCKYCFRESEYLENEQLTFKVAKDAIDFLVDKYAPCASKYVVDLSGSGEPLLQIDLVKQIVDYCKQKRNEICKNIEVMFCTNLTLLNAEMVEYLDNEPAIILGTSIDGDQITNDNNRVYANGKGTYKDIVKGLKMFKNKKLGLAVTITPLNQDIDLIYDFLYHLPNVDCISMKYIRCYDGSKYDFDNFDVSYLISRYEKLCNNIFNEIAAGNFDYLKKLLQGADYFGSLILGRIFKSTYKIYGCDAGKSRVTVNNKGDIFSCSVMYSNNDFKIGNIYEGIEKEKQKIFEFVSIENTQKCSNCVIKNLCGGECYVNSYLNNKDFYTPIDKMCVLKNELNKLCMAFNNKIKNDFGAEYKKLSDFTLKVNKYEITPFEVWAIMSYLKLRDICVSYADVVSFTSKFENVIEGIIKYIEKFDNTISIYKLDTNIEIKIPAIAIINKAKTNTPSFAVIKDIKNNNFVYMEYASCRKEGAKKSNIYQFKNYLSDILLY